MYRFLCISLAICCFSNNLLAKELLTSGHIHVDVLSGNDANTGTIAAPLKALRTAQEHARRLYQQQPQDVTVLLRAGQYALTTPWEFTLADSTNGEHRITYAAFGEEQVSITGGEPITDWQQAGKLWRAKLPQSPTAWQFRELFVNGERRVRARTPNQGYHRLLKAGMDRRTSFTYRPGEVPAVADVSRLELVFLHDWSISRIPFSRIEAATHTAYLAYPVGFSAPHYAMDHFEQHPRYFLENARELLDEPGEWFLDVPSQTIYYWPKTGEEINRTTIVAPRQTALVRVTGDLKSGEPVRGLRFMNLTFEHCRWEIPERGYTEGQATKHDPRDGVSKPGSLRMIPAAIELDLVTQCSVEQCNIQHLGTSGIWFRRECDDCLVHDCQVSDIAGNGIMIGEVHPRKAPTSSQSKQANGLTRNVRLERNKVSSCGQLYYGAVGIWLGITADCRVVENHVHHLPYTGISLGWSWNPHPTGAGGNHIVNNHIHDVLQTLSDGGGIYTLGNQPGTKLVGNRIYHVPLNAGRAESNGIFMDEGSSEILVQQNIIHEITRSPIRFHKALNNKIVDNQLAHADDVPMFKFNACQESAMRFENNRRLVNPGELPSP